MSRYSHAFFFDECLSFLIFSALIRIPEPHLIVDVSFPIALMACASKSSKGIFVHRDLNEVDNKILH